VHQKVVENTVDEVDDYSASLGYKMVGTENELLNHIKSRKLRYIGHVMRQSHDNVEGSVMVGLVKGVRNRGRQRMCWLDNI